MLSYWSHTNLHHDEKVKWNWNCQRCEHTTWVVGGSPFGKCRVFDCRAMTKSDLIQRPRFVLLPVLGTLDFQLKACLAFKLIGKISQQQVMMLMMMMMLLLLLVTRLLLPDLYFPASKPCRLGEIGEIDDLGCCPTWPWVRFEVSYATVL